MEALGSATSFISQCEFNRAWVENIPTSDFSLPVWISSQVFACHLSSVILTDIIQTVLETSECFLSNTNNNMHILATETEEQAVYSGHLWAPFIQATQYCPCSHKTFLMGKTGFCRPNERHRLSIPTAFPSRSHEKVVRLRGPCEGICTNVTICTYWWHR